MKKNNEFTLLVLAIVLVITQLTKEIGPLTLLIQVVFLYLFLGRFIQILKAFLITAIKNNEKEVKGND